MAIVEEVVGGARTIGTQSTDHRRWYRNRPDQRHCLRGPGGDPLAIGGGLVEIRSGEPETDEGDLLTHPVDGYERLSDPDADSNSDAEGPGSEAFLREPARSVASEH